MGITQNGPLCGPAVDFITYVSCNHVRLLLGSVKLILEGVSGRLQEAIAVNGFFMLPAAWTESCINTKKKKREGLEIPTRLANMPKTAHTHDSVRSFGQLFPLKRHVLLASPNELRHPVPWSYGTGEVLCCCARGTSETDTALHAERTSGHWRRNWTSWRHAVHPGSTRTKTDDLVVSHHFYPSVQSPDFKSKRYLYLYHLFL